MKLRTDRLLIREFAPGDWKDFQKIIVDFVDSPYAIYDHAMPTGEQEVRQLAGDFAGTGLWFAVFLQESEKMIGYFCFREEKGIYDLGYCFHSKYHGKGYAFESCTALMRFLEESREVKGFSSGTALKNVPSCRLLKKLGFVQTGTEQVSFCKDQDGNDIIFEGGSFIKSVR